MGSVAHLSKQVLKDLEELCSTLYKNQGEKLATLVSVAVPIGALILFWDIMIAKWYENRCTVVWTSPSPTTPTAAARIMQPPISSRRLQPPQTQQTQGIR